MSSLRRLDKDHAKAELAAVKSLIAQLRANDFLSRFSLEARSRDLSDLIARLDDDPVAGGASASLFFGGRPVLNQSGIEAEFAGQAVAHFQDLVSKLYALNTVGLAARGVVPNKAASALHITNIVRGSFGFLLEEGPQTAIVPTPLNSVVEDATKLLAALGEQDEEAFRSVVETVDARVLDTAESFFALLQDSGATLRLVTGQTEQQFGADAVQRAVNRAASTEVRDSPESIAGMWGGALPEGHQFEFRPADGRGTIRGKVDKSITAAQLANLNVSWTNIQCEAQVVVRRVIENGTVVRTSYILTGIEAERPQDQHVVIQRD